MTKKATTTIIAVSALALVGLGAYLVFGRKKGQPTPAPDPNDQGNGDNGDNGGGNGGSGSQAPDFTEMADTIFEAMDGYGTNFTDIKAEVSRLRSRSEWNSLVSAYGIRTVDSGAGNIFVGNFTGDLAECLKDELRSSQIAELNTIIGKFGVSI